MEKEQPTRAVAIRPDTTYFNPQHWNVMKVMAETFIKSGALPRHIQNAAQLVMIMQTGAELGFKPMQSINSLYIVNGRVALQSQAMSTKLLQSGVKLKWLKDTETEAQVELSGLGREPYTASFTIEEAKKAGLTNKPDSPWLKYPKAMLRARALSTGARVFCPDLLSGSYTLEEVAEVTVDSEGVEHYEAPKNLDAAPDADKVPKAPKGKDPLPPRIDPHLEIKKLIRDECVRLNIDLTDPYIKKRLEEKTGHSMDDPANFPIILDTLREIPTPPKEPTEPQNPTPPPAEGTPNAEKPAETAAGERGEEETEEQPAGTDPEWKPDPEPPADEPTVEQPAEPKQTPEEKRAADIAARDAMPAEERASNQAIGLFKSLLQTREGVEQDNLEAQLGYLSLVHDTDVDRLEQLRSSELSAITKKLLNQPAKREAA